MTFVKAPSAIRRYIYVVIRVLVSASPVLLSEGKEWKRNEWASRLLVSGSLICTHTLAAHAAVQQTDLPRWAGRKTSFAFSRLRLSAVGVIKLKLEPVLEENVTASRRTGGQPGLL